MGRGLMRGSALFSVTSVKHISATECVGLLDRGAILLYFDTSNESFATALLRLPLEDLVWRQPQSNSGSCGAET